MISPVLIWGFVEMDKAYMHIYWFEGQGVILKQKVCSTTPIEIKS